MKKNKNSYLLSKRLNVLKIAKNVIAKKGINNSSFLEISKISKINKNEIDLIFPGGHKDLLNFALLQLNKDLDNSCKNLDLIRFPLHKRIRKILLTKFFLMNKEKDFYRKIFFNLLFQKKIYYLPSQLYKSIDQIWFIAGDTSIDFNFYTKRLILSGIYIRLVLFFFNNDNQIKLESILDNSLKKVGKIPELKSKIKIAKNNIPNILNFLKNYN